MIQFLIDMVGLCMQYGGSVTSWVRSPERNRRVGGHPQSYHQAGMAVDVILDDWSQRKAFSDRVRKLGYKPLDEGDHIHIQMK